MTRPTLLAISHGTDSAAGRAAVAGLVREVASALPDGRVRAGFVDVQHPGPSELIDLEAEPLDADAGHGGRPPHPPVIVPLLLSAGYHVHVDLVAAAAGRARLAPALGPDARLAEVAVDRLAEAGLGPRDAVVMAAAGSSDPRAVADCRAARDLLAARLGRPVRIGFLSAASPNLADAVVAARRGCTRPAPARVVISPYLLAPGFFLDRAAAAGADAVAGPLLDPDGPVPPALVRLVLERHRAAATRAVVPDAAPAVA